MKDRKWKRALRIIPAVILIAVVFVGGCAGTAPRRQVVPALSEDAALEQANEYFLEGKMAEAKEDWGAAAAAYTEALQFDPESDEIVISLAKVFLRDGKLRSSLLYARLAVELNDQVPEYWQIVQYLEEREGHFEEAAEALEHYIELSEDHTLMHDIRLSQYYFALGQDGDGKKLLIKRADNPRTPAAEIYEVARILLLNDFEEDAEEVLSDLIERDPLDVQAWLLLGELYMSAGDREKALATHQEALDRNPDNIFIMLTIGNQCLADNNWDCALTYFERAAHEGERAAEGTGVAYIDILQTLTAVYYYAGRDRDAEELFESLRTAGEDDAGFYFSLGKAMNYLERYEESIEYYRSSFTRDLSELSQESLVRAFSGYAGALINAGKGDEALRVIHDDTAGLIEDSIIIRSLEASVCLELKRYPEAISIYEWLSASDPENRGYLFSLSLAYDMSDRFEDAERTLLTLLDRSPEDNLALNNLAYMYLENDVNFDRALTMVQQALISEPNNGAYLDTLAWAYYKLGKYKDARKHVERALKWAEADDFGVIYEHYGDILANLGKTNDAISAYQQAIEHGEDADRIQPKIDDLAR